jgi:hypothetical protein
VPTDLAVQAVEVLPQVPSAGETTRITFALANTGTDASEGVVVAGYVDGVRAWSAPFDAIAPREAATRTWNWTASAGLHQIAFRVTDASGTDVPVANRVLLERTIVVNEAAKPKLLGVPGFEGLAALAAVAGACALAGRRRVG